MEFEELFKIEKERCDKMVIKSIFIMMLFFSFILILNVLNIFIIDKSAMNLIYIVVMGFLASIMFVAGFYKRTILKPYVIVTLLVMAIGIIYSTLTYHAILLFLYPVALINIYGRKRVTKYAIVLTLIIMLVSHILSYFFSINDAEPFDSMYDVLVFGFAPKMLIYLALAYIFTYATEHNNEMLKSVYQYARDMYTTQYELVNSFSEISESKSGQTGQHVKRVSEYVSVMADKVGITGKEKEAVVIASMMHDVGKLMIPLEILDKPGKLTAEEFAEIKKHTQYGYDMLKNSPGRIMEIGKEIALEHHEKWDGTGYAGKKGEDISYYGRLTAIADVFDALVSRRSYKEGWNPQDAYDEIVSQSGKQFDPALVEVFKECYPDFIKILEKYKD